MYKIKLSKVLKFFKSMSRRKNTNSFGEGKLTFTESNCFPLTTPIGAAKKKIELGVKRW